MWKITTALVNWENRNATKKARKIAHKQNELDMLGGEIPEIGGKIEDQANAYAGKLVKKYGKQTPNLYLESKIDIISPSSLFLITYAYRGSSKVVIEAANVIH